MNKNVFWDSTIYNLIAALQFDQLQELEMALQQESDNCSQQQQQQQQPQQQIQVEHSEEAVLPPSPIAEEIVDLSNAHAGSDVKPNLGWATMAYPNSRNSVTTKL